MGRAGPGPGGVGLQALGSGPAGTLGSPAKTGDGAGWSGAGRPAGAPAALLAGGPAAALLQTRVQVSRAPGRRARSPPARRGGLLCPAVCGCQALPPDV